MRRHRAVSSACTGSLSPGYQGTAPTASTAWGMHWAAVSHAGMGHAPIRRARTQPCAAPSDGAVTGHAPATGTYPATRHPSMGCVLSHVAPTQPWDTHTAMGHALSHRAPTLLWGTHPAMGHRLRYGICRSHEAPARPWGTHPAMGCPLRQRPPSQLWGTHPGHRALTQPWGIHPAIGYLPSHGHAPTPRARTQPWVTLLPTQPRGGAGSGLCQLPRAAGRTRCGAGTRQNRRKEEALECPSPAPAAARADAYRHLRCRRTGPSPVSLTSAPPTTERGAEKRHCWSRVSPP